MRIDAAPWTVGKRIAGQWPFVAGIAVLAFLILVPLYQLLSTSFQAGSPGLSEGWTVQHYKDAVSGTSFAAFRNTFLVAACSTVLSVAFATALAWLVERTNLPFRNLVWVVVLLPIAVPGILTTMSWSMLLQPRSGVVNGWIRDVVGVVGVHPHSGPLNVFSLAGLVFVDAFRGVSTAFLMIVGGFRLFDHSLEEAARVSGARTWPTLRRITLRVMTPAILAAAVYAFIANMESFESALVLGLPANIFLVSTLIYYSVQVRSPADYGLAAVYAVIFMVLMVVLVVLYRRAVTRQSKRFVTVSGKGLRLQRLDLGRWRWPALGIVAAFLLGTVVLPIGYLVWMSLKPSLASDSALTLANYRDLAHLTGLGGLTGNTVFLVLGTATLTMAVAFIVSWAVTRGRVRGRGALDGLSFVGFAFPGITIAIAFIFVFLNPPLNNLQLYGTVAVIILALTTHYVAFGTRLMSGALVQISPELEEAGRVGGAGNLRVLGRVTVPILVPTLAAGWIWVAAAAVRAFSTPLILSSTDNQVFGPKVWGLWTSQQFGESAALGVVMMAVLMVLMIFMRRGLIGVGGVG